MPASARRDAFGRHAVADTDIDVTTLAGAQLDGTACVVCGREFTDTEHPTEVGYVGSGHSAVYACPRPCARSLYRLVTDNRPRHAIAGRAEQWPA